MTILTLNDYHQLEQAAKRLGTARNTAAFKSLENTKAYKIVKKFVDIDEEDYHEHELPKISPELVYVMNMEGDTHQDIVEEVINDMSGFINNGIYGSLTNSRDKEYHKLIADRFPNIYIRMVTQQPSDMFMDIVRQAMQRANRDTRRMAAQSLQRYIARSKR